MAIVECGKRFSEGARQIWLRLAERGESVESFRLRAGFQNATLFRYMRGQRRPDRTAASKFTLLLGIDPTLFDAPPVEPFEFPKATAAAAKSSPDVSAPADSGLDVTDDSDEHPAAKAEATGTHPAGS